MEVIDILDLLKVLTKQRMLHEVKQAMMTDTESTLSLEEHPIPGSHTRSLCCICNMRVSAVVQYNYRSMFLTPSPPMPFSLSMPQ